MKKRVVIIVGSILLTLILVVLGYMGMKYFQKKEADKMLLKEIQSHYSEYVAVQTGNLYCKKDNQYETCGSIQNNMHVALTTEEIKNVKNQYFNIAGTDYYLFYTDVTPADKVEVSYPSYLVFNQNIHTKGNTNLYQNGNLVIQINQEMDFVIFYQDAENYYITYLEQIFAIPKTENMEIIESQNTEEVAAEQIPVLYYDNMETWKETDNWKEQIALLREKGFYTISLIDFEAWLHGNIRLKDKAILLLSQSEELVEEYQFYNKTSSSVSFSITNSVAKINSANLYQVKATTTKEQFETMLAGEPIIIPAKEQKVAVLNYHFFYNPDAGEACNENICLATSKFEEQLQYLKNNGYYTLTMTEFRDWMYGKINIPEKSVLLTIDDGAAGTGKHNGNKLIPLLEKYDLHATLFLITGWWSIENYRSPNLDVESHTNDMHTMYQNGAQLLISTNEQVINDLNQSIAVTGSKKAFCFPFYAYNSTAIRQVQEVGFELAFIGGNYKASRSNNKYMIPRYPIYKNITMQQFINMIS